MARGKRPFRNGGGPVFKKARKAHRSDGTRALSLIRAQLKQRETMYTNQDMLIGTRQGTVQPISRVSGGSEAGQRTGDKLTLKSLYVRSTVIKPHVSDAADAAIEGDCFHLAVVLQKVVGDTLQTPDWGDVFDGDPIQGPTFNLEGRGEFTVLAQEKFIINAQSITTESGTGHLIVFNQKMADWYPKVKGLPQWYKGTADSSGYKNRLWIFARSQQIGTDGGEVGEGTTQAHIRIRTGFTDTS